ncbi:MAG TPA: UvrD-helicase domain-containing protein, partial [Croceibacterium sp.]
MPELTILNDDGARHDAICRHDRSILVEAGAGSGKTAVMAGRIAVMLAQGVSPRSIAAVTFTELAASELVCRVREFVEALAAGDVGVELRVGLPDGLSEVQRINLAAASAAIDEITCSTIHGFCQRLIKPYPVEADIDPGASVMDSGQADLVFLETVDAQLRERLSEGQGGILAEMVLHADGATVALMHTIAKKLRGRRDLVAPATEPLAGRVDAFRQASADLSAFLNSAVVVEPETGMIAELLSQMSAALPTAAALATPAGLVGLLVSRPHPDL